VALSIHRTSKPLNTINSRVLVSCVSYLQTLSGLRGLEVAFPPHDPSDAGSNPAEVVEFLRTEKFRERSPSEGTLSRFTRVVDLLHVKDPQSSQRELLGKIADIFPFKKLTVSPPEGLVPLFSGRWN
jgi:hypothetical protein